MAEKICATSTACELDFDYQQLNSQTREQVQKLTLEIKNRLRRCAQDIVEIGNSLCIIKQQLQHGQFRHWLKAEFDWSVSMANKFMQVSKQFKPEELEQVEIAPSALYILAAPSTPEQVRTQALDQAKQGHPITFSLAKQMLEDSKSEDSTETKESSDQAACGCEEQDVVVVQTKLSYRINVHEYSSSDCSLVYSCSDFKHYLKQEWRRMARTEQELSLILCQVGFKDCQKSKLITHRTIEQIASGLANTVKRAGDFVGNYHDNQLAAVLPNTDLAGSKHVAKEFLAWFAAKKRNLSRLDRLQNVTLSLGVATTTPDHKTGYDVLLQTAERALLEAVACEDH